MKTFLGVNPQFIGRKVTASPKNKRPPVLPLKKKLPSDSSFRTCEKRNDPRHKRDFCSVLDSDPYQPRIPPKEIVEKPRIRGFMKSLETTWMIKMAQECQYLELTESNGSWKRSHPVGQAENSEHLISEQVVAFTKASKIVCSNISIAILRPREKHKRGQEEKYAWNGSPTTTLSNFLQYISTIAIFVYITTLSLLLRVRSEVPNNNAIRYVTFQCHHSVVTHLFRARSRKVLRRFTRENNCALSPSS